MNDLVDYFENLEHSYWCVDSCHLHSILDYTLYLVDHIANAYDIDPSHHQLMRHGYCVLQSQYVVDSFIQEKRTLKDHVNQDYQGQYSIKDVRYVSESIQGLVRDRLHARLYYKTKQNDREEDHVQSLVCCKVFSQMRWGSCLQHYFHSTDLQNVKGENGACDARKEDSDEA